MNMGNVKKEKVKKNKLYSVKHGNNFKAVSL